MNNVIRITPDTILAALTLLFLMIGGYVKIMSKIKELEIRISTVEKQDDKILTKLDEIVEKVNEIKIDLQNKQDKN